MSQLKLILSEEEARHVHDCLRWTKESNTTYGQMWPLHTMNAHIRTSIEQMLAKGERQ